MVSRCALVPGLLVLVELAWELTNSVERAHKSVYLILFVIKRVSYSNALEVIEISEQEMQPEPLEFTMGSMQICSQAMSMFDEHDRIKQLNF